ncbi:uncharacterized protein EDB91DRAFT_1138610 [Suillus paluster]|uniref:uncharacterized protein n=1 Tax=Suillus paluster TaxID=48578 RepID=UPI001B8674AD|nr:uncharacterized protein EDB91DRAFT_1138610 [Suillus paluster]KAG1738401.1 hypothetical protein EDB91DRAFT_1138610 [Suillus paluster]
MFPTVRPPWLCQCQVAPNNPDISLPGRLHDARYEGWPHPEKQLPHVALPPSTTQRVPFAIDIPSHRLYHDVNAAHTQHHPIHTQYKTRPHINPWAQDMMGPVDSQRQKVPASWAWSSGFSVIASSSDDYNSAQQLIPLNANETPKVYPHPFLAPPSVPLIYDLRYSPTSLHFPSSSPYAGYGYELLRVPLTPERPRQIRLVSPDFPWAFDISPSAGEECVTCLGDLAALHAALQRPLTDTEWGTAGDDKRASLIRARVRRLGMEPALHGSSNSASRTRSTVSFAPSADASNHRPVQRWPPLLRVDWLGSRVAFVGLVKDEMFARDRLIAGGGEAPETWVVKFQR